MYDLICKFNLINLNKLSLINDKIIINNSGSKFISGIKKKGTYVYVFLFLLKIILNQRYNLIFPKKTNTFFNLRKNQIMGCQSKLFLLKKKNIFLDNLFIKNITIVTNNVTTPFFFQNNLNQFLGLNKTFRLNYLKSKQKSYLKVSLNDYLEFNLLILK
jgi:hypothetical protein